MTIACDRALCSSRGRARQKPVAGLVAACNPCPRARLGRMLCAVDARSIRVAAAALRHDSHQRSRRHDPSTRRAGGMHTRAEMKHSPH